MKMIGAHLETATLDTEAAELWACEQAYWRLLEAGDPAVLALYREDFVGWPSNAATPRERAGMAAALAGGPVAAQPLELLGIAVADGCAVVHLARGVATTGPDGRELPPSKVMHTWQRVDGAWRLLGGIGGYGVGG